MVDTADLKSVFRPCIPAEHLLALASLHVRDQARKKMISRAEIVAVGITSSARCSAIEFGVSEDETFWAAFLRRLRERGLAGVQLVASSCQKPVHPLLVHQPAFPPH